MANCRFHLAFRITRLIDNWQSEIYNDSSDFGLRTT